jgi:hypothetical protein
LGRFAVVVLTVMPIGAPIPVFSLFHVEMKSPLLPLSLTTRPLPLSATYTLPEESTPTSRGCWNCTLPALAAVPSEPMRHTVPPVGVYSATWSLPVSAITTLPLGAISMPDGYIAA